MRFVRGLIIFALGYIVGVIATREVDHRTLPGDEHEWPEAWDAAV